MEKRTVIVEDITIRQKAMRPGPHDVEVLRFVRIPSETVQVEPVQNETKREKPSCHNGFAFRDNRRCSGGSSGGIRVELSVACSLLRRRIHNSLKEGVFAYPAKRFNPGFRADSSTIRDPFDDPLYLDDAFLWRLAADAQHFLRPPQVLHAQVAEIRIETVGLYLNRGLSRFTALES